MIRLHQCWFARTLSCLLLIAIATPAAHSDLTKNQIKILETEFLPAWQVGNTYGVLESLSKAIRSMSEEQIAELDGLLLKQEIPPSGHILLEARLVLLQQNLGQQLPRPRAKELLISLEFISDDVSSLMNESVALIKALDQSNEHTSFESFDKMLWDTHVLTQKIRSSLIMVEYTVGLLSEKNRYRIDKLDESQKELFDTDFSTYLDELRTVQQNLGELEIVGRVNRLGHARNTLGDQEADLKKKYLAAWSINQDVELIRESLKSGKATFTHEVLTDNNLSKRIGDYVSQGERLAGRDLLVKSRLLFEGLHWWYRGRYGMGTDGFGLLKSPEAVTSDEAAFALYMPETPPRPTNPSDTSRYQIPEVDRRHNYIWAWEYRIVDVESDTKHSSFSTQRITQETGLSRFY